MLTDKNIKIKSYNMASTLTVVIVEYSMFRLKEKGITYKQNTINS